MQITFSLLHLVFVGFVALFPPVNPIGTSLMIDPFLNQLSESQRKGAAFKIASYSFILCSGAVLVGSWLFKLFGISLPVVQLAGGILICKMGWDLLSSNSTDKDTDPSPERPATDVENILFYPLAFPMTTGAGTISVLLTLSAHGHGTDLWSYLNNLAALIAAVALMCATVYVCYAYTPTLLKRLGSKGGLIVNRLSAFLVFCVGLQIAIDGITHLVSKAAS
jgi:multiple antibiotic resistance protein